MYLYTHFAFSGLAAPHNSDYVVFLFLDYKAQAFDLTTMLYTGCDNIDTGSIDGAVSQNIGQLGDVLFDAIESAGKEFSQVVGKDLRRLHAGSLTQFLHSGPDITTVQRFAGASNEYHAGDNTVPLGVIQ